MYTEFNKNLERYSKCVYIVLVDVALGFGTACLLSLSYINYYILDLKEEAFLLSAPAMYVSFMDSKRNIQIFLNLLNFSFDRFPFNWKTPFGYLIAELSETASYLSIVLCRIPILCFFWGSCGLFCLFIRDITSDLELLNVGGASDQSRKKRQERFGKIIQLHSDVKQLS